MTYTHAIITFTKSHHLITEVEHGLLYMLGAKDVFETADGSRITGSNIAEVIPIGKYYELYPEKKPAREVVDVNQLLLEQGMVEQAVTSKEIISRSSVKGLREMMKGFLKFGKAAHPLYQHMEHKLQELEYVDKRA